RSNNRMLEDLSDLRLAAILRANVDKNKSVGSPFPIVARDGKTAAALEWAPGDMQAAMTSRPNVTDRAAQRTKLPVLRYVDNPQLAHFIFLVKAIRIACHQRPINGRRIGFHHPRQCVTSIR